MRALYRISVGHPAFRVPNFGTRSACCLFPLSPRVPSPFPPPPPRGLFPIDPFLLPPPPRQSCCGCQEAVFQPGGASSQIAETTAALIPEACFILATFPPPPTAWQHSFPCVFVGEGGGGGGGTTQAETGARFGSPARAQLFFRPQRSGVFLGGGGAALSFLSLSLVFQAFAG